MVGIKLDLKLKNKPIPYKFGCAEPVIIGIRNIFIITTVNICTLFLIKQEISYLK